MKARFVLLIAVLSSGCASLPDGDRDGAPVRPAVNPHRVPDAVPRYEPRSRYGNPESYDVFGKTYYVMDSAVGFRQRGDASWYGTKFHGRRTSSGEPYDMYAMTAAHKELPLPTYVRVRNLENGREVIVRVNDRGPFHPGRIIDLSYSAAAKLGILDAGSAPVEIEAITPGQQAPEPAPWPPGRAAAPERPTDRSVSAATTPQAVSLPVGTRYYLQVGAYRDAGNAYDLMRYLREHGINDAEIREADVFGAPLLRVYAGPYEDMAELEAMRGKLESLQLAPSTVAE